MREKEDRFTVAFDRNAVSPLAAKTGLDLHGGLRYAGQDGFPDYQGDPSKTKFSPRVGVAWALNEKTVARGGYGLFWSPWIYVSPGTTNYGQTGYTRETFVDQSSPLIPTASLDNPFPNGLLKPVGNTLGLLTGVGGQIDFVSRIGNRLTCSSILWTSNESFRSDGGVDRLRRIAWRQPMAAPAPPS